MSSYREELLRSAAHLLSISRRYRFSEKDTDHLELSVKRLVELADRVESSAPQSTTEAMTFCDHCGAKHTCCYCGEVQK